MMTRRSFLAALILLVAVRVGADEPATQPAKRIACVGDSITYGSRIDNREHDCYPAQLGRLLGAGWDVQNFGVSGATMVKDGDKPYMDQKAYRAAISFKPDIVVIMLGTNDSKPQNWMHKDNYARDYKELITSFREANPEAKVYVCLPPPAWASRTTIRGEVIEEEIIPLVKQVAKETKSNLIDIHAALLGKKEFFPDGIHPNADGAAIMAKTVAAALK